MQGVISKAKSSDFTPNLNVLRLKASGSIAVLLFSIFMLEIFTKLVKN